MSPTVQLLITCLLDTFYPQIGESVVRVLQRAGATVEFPTRQTCCGQPAFNAGLRQQARQMAEHTIQTFEAVHGPVVVPSGSCAAMIRHGYPELFAQDAHWLPRAVALAERTYEFTEYLVDILGITDLGSTFYGRITYHASCHLLRELGIDRQPRTLLKAVRQAEFIELGEATDCCGFGGVFSVEHPEISSAMLARKINHIEASQAAAVISCDAGCIMHINAGLIRMRKKPRALHIAQILDTIM